MAKMSTTTIQDTKASAKPTISKQAEAQVNHAVGTSNYSNRKEDTHHTECCIICYQQKANGMRLFEAFICKTCEEEIVQTDATDKKYQFFVKQLRRLYQK